MRCWICGRRSSRLGHYVMVAMVMILNGKIFAVDDLEERA
jgi:hypothetical protein